MTGMTTIRRERPIGKSSAGETLCVVPHDRFRPQRLLHATLPITADALFKLRFEDIIGHDIWVINERNER